MFDWIPALFKWLASFAGTKKAESEDERAWRIAQAIHTTLGQGNRGVKLGWERAVRHHNQARPAGDYDEIDIVLAAIKEGRTVYVIGGSGVIRVDPRTGNVIDGANLVGVTQVSL